MRSWKITAPLLASAALVLAPVSHAASTAPLTPRVATAGVTHLLSNSALLNALIYPNGTPTGYYFQYGPTLFYGSQTPTVNVGAGPAKVKVGQQVGGLQQGVVYHYRVVGVYGAGTLVMGRDLSFTPKQTPLAFQLPKNVQAVVGTPFILSGTLTGFGSAHHQVVLQASPFPYLEAFSNIGVPGVTDAAGRFSFRVANLSRSTQFRVSTLDLRPIISPVSTVRAAVRVTLSARSSGHTGLVRLFGTVTPAAVGAQVQFQLQKSVRSNNPEEPEPVVRFVTQFTSTVKKAGRTFSRFSLVAKVRRGGRYRAFVRLHSGPLVSGASIQTVLLHAAPGKAKH
ncbi:MAG: hypothetical protein JWL67_775 [Solirubrobacterales bacterium]|nr:hypothetical protein [Solirubrobacterales bacterium]